MKSVRENATKQKDRDKEHKRSRPISRDLQDDFLSRDDKKDEEMSQTGEDSRSSSTSTQNQHIKKEEMSRTNLAAFGNNGWASCKQAPRFALKEPRLQ